jgi:dephospho-CoA kinase
VAGLFAERGARIFDADAVAHAILRTEAVRAKLVALFGEGILGPDGEIDRPRLADAAFGPPPRTEALNEAVHPEVRRLLEAELARAGGVTVVDAALLLEGGLLDLCDLVVFVEADEATRGARAESRGWDRAEWRRREESQAGLEEKRGVSRAVIDNNGSLEETRKQVEAIVRKWNVPAEGDGPSGAEIPTD